MHASRAARSFPFPLATALLAVALLAAGPGRAEPPPGLVEEAEAAFAICSDLGGSAQILGGYRTEADLNGDGVTDYVTDLGHLECAGAWSAFCGSGGCPVAAWLSEPDGTYSRFDLGLLQGFEILPGARGALPTLRAGYHGAFCEADAIGAETCSRSWVFDSNAPRSPDIDGDPAPRGAAPETAAAPSQDAARDPPEDAPLEGATASETDLETAPETPPARSIPSAAAPPPAAPVAPGWTLRRVPGSSPVALGGGTGRVASLAAFCLQDVPFLAVSFADPPGEESIELGFGFSEGDVTVEAGFEDTAGGAYVLALDEGVLAARLAGRDSEVALRAGGVDEGILSLDGSTSSIRAALGGCHGF